MIQPTLFDTGVPSRVGAAAVSESDSRHILTPGNGRTSAYDFSLNPYRGCSFGCAYCYAAFFVPDEGQRDSWGQWVEARTRSVDVLRSKDLNGKRLYMSSVTDPYQPVEAKLELTRAVVEELLRQRARLVVQTRSPLVPRDIDLFRQFEHVRVNVSITTDDDAVRRQFEPTCSSIERRLEAIEALKAAGLRVAVCVCPMLPMNDPEAFGRRLDRIGVDAVTASWFHHSDRPFAAGTRPGAKSLANDLEWTRPAYERARDALRSGCSAYTTADVAFGPA